MKPHVRQHQVHATQRVQAVRLGPGSGGAKRAYELLGSHLAQQRIDIAAASVVSQEIVVVAACDQAAFAPAQIIKQRCKLRLRKLLRVLGPQCFGQHPRVVMVIAVQLDGVAQQQQDVGLAPPRMSSHAGCKA